jgi:hypothetical protein
MAHEYRASADFRVVDAPVMIARLQTFVSRMERRYECTSDQMEKDVAAGRTRETAEVSRWLGEYRALLSLQALDPEGGWPSGATGKSTTAAWTRSAGRRLSTATP